MRSKWDATNGSCTYVGVKVDFLKDVLKDPPIRGATKFSQVCLLWRIDCDHCMIVWGDEEFVKITNWMIGLV
jgi:hypothetical protein